MRAILIDPFTKTVEEIDIPSTDFIKQVIGAPHFDIARLGSSVVAFVDDFGLYRKDQRFWQFDMPGGRVIMAGKALLLSNDDQGETVGLDIRATLDHTRRYVEWLETGAHVEALIRVGLLTRPQTTVNGKVVWEWSPAVQTM